jgi:sulfide:quinone oxidoreductase
VSPYVPRRVLVAGGGVAGLEALLALHDLAGERVALTLLSDGDELVYRPMAVAEPFSRGRATRYPLAALAAEVGAELMRGRLVAVDARSQTAITTAGERLRYDALLVAVGARADAAVRGAMTWTPESDPELFGGLLRDLEEGYSKRVAFVVPPGVAWSLPAYELALMTAWQVWGMGQDDVETTVYTPEHAPLGLFGLRAAAAVRGDLEEAGIRIRTGVCVMDDPLADGRLVVHPGEQPLTADRVVALATARGPGLVGLPCDGDGFVPVDGHGRVLGLDGVWAAGDATTFPIKQGGLAAQQADAAAASIAAAVGAGLDPAPFAPVLRGMMLTGRGKLWMLREFDDDRDAVNRRALWWPPTKIAGRYLAPHLAGLDGADAAGDAAPAGAPVELDLQLLPEPVRRP